jgi:hypothetical protein
MVGFIPFYIKFYIIKFMRTYKAKTEAIVLVVTFKFINSYE